MLLPVVVGKRILMLLTYKEDAWLSVVDDEVVLALAAA